MVVHPGKWPLSICPAVASRSASENGFSKRATPGSSLPWEASQVTVRELLAAGAAEFLAKPGLVAATLRAVPARRHSNGRGSVPPRRWPRVLGWLGRARGRDHDLGGERVPG